MLELGVSSGLEQLGFKPQPVFVCEWESATAAVLRQRMEDEAMEPCPIWCGDMGTFDGRPFRGLVDVLVAGLPCQPFSVTGREAGNKDCRAWGTGQGPQPNFLRLITEIEPAMVFLENVSFWLDRGHFRRFGQELSRLGYRVEEPFFVRAQEVGASHERNRAFILAHAERRPMGDAKCGGWTQGDGGQQVAPPEIAAVGLHPQVFAPGPRCDEWPTIITNAKHLAPAVEPGFRVLVDGVAVVVDKARADQLRQIGNGVVPLQAAVAFIELFRRVVSESVS